MKASNSRFRAGDRARGGRSPYALPAHHLGLRHLGNVSSWEELAGGDAALHSGRWRGGNGEGRVCSFYPTVCKAWKQGASWAATICKLASGRGKWRCHGERACRSWHASTASLAGRGQQGLTDGTRGEMLRQQTEAAYMPMIWGAHRACALFSVTDGGLTMSLWLHLQQCLSQQQPGALGAQRESPSPAGAAAEAAAGSQGQAAAEPGAAELPQDSNTACRPASECAVRCPAQGQHSQLCKSPHPRPGSLSKP